MATRSEKFHADEQRTGNDKAKREGRSKPGIPADKRSHEKPHAEKKATYAIEPESEQPSRKSTRKSANRSKPDTNLNLRENLQKGSPEAKARQAKARVTKVRGSSTPA